MTVRGLEDVWIFYRREIESTGAKKDRARLPPPEGEGSSGVIGR